MAASALFDLSLPVPVTPAKTLAPRPLALAAVAPGKCVRVLELKLEEDVRQWLGAVGIGEGELLLVLRRAAFGGPIHVRTRSGGEFALNLALARSIEIRPVEEGEELAG